MLRGITDDPADQWRHYHRIFIDSFEPDMFSEVLHTHEFTETGHTHQVTISRAYKKVDLEI